jgi:hypothetical protein
VSEHAKPPNKAVMEALVGHTIKQVRFAHEASRGATHWALILDDGSRLRFKTNTFIDVLDNQNNEVARSRS